MDAADADVAEAVFVAPPLDVAAFDVAGLDVAHRVYAGDADAFVDVARLKALVEAPVIVPGANHSFSRGLPALARAVAAQLGHTLGTVWAPAAFTFLAMEWAPWGWAVIAGTVIVATLLLPVAVRAALAYLPEHARATSMAQD